MRSLEGRYITNFRKENVSLYIQTIAIYGDENLEVREHPNPDTNPLDPANFFSLFYKGQDPKLGEFWQVFRNLEALMK